MARRKVTTRRRRSSPRALGGFVPAGTFTTVAMTAGGFIGSQWLVDQLPLPPQMKVGNGRIAAKAAAAIVGSMMLKKFVGTKAATGFLVGGLTSVALDLFAKANLQGMGANIGVPGGVDYSQPLIGVGEGMDDEFDMMGVGASQVDFMA